MKRTVFLVISIAALFSLRPSSVSAQGGPPPPNPYRSEFLLGVGYSNISLGSSSPLNNEGALHFDPSLSFAPFQKLPQLRLGANMGVSLVLDNSSRTLIIDNGQVLFIGSSDIPLWTLEPELCVSWRQIFGYNNEFYIEPGIAGGGMFGFLHLSSEEENVNDYDANSQTGYGRVFVRAGLRVPSGSAGLEGSYLAGGKLNFGNGISGDVSEWYIGIYGSLEF
jgi:hypothetical protein